MRLLRVGSSVLLAAGLFLLSGIPARASQPHTRNAAIRAAKQLVTASGANHGSTEYRFLASRQQSLLTERQLAVCLNPPGSPLTGAHVVSVRGTRSAIVTVYGYPKRLSATVVEMTLANTGGTMRRDFNGSLIYERGNWRWYLRKQDIESCK